MSSEKAQCIICGEDPTDGPVEHIIPESMGNVHYVLEEGILCKNCNNKFSKFEGKAQSETVLGMERARLGVSTKRGRGAKAKIDGKEFEGIPNSKEQIINVKGLKPDDMESFDEESNQFQLTVSGFGKAAVPVSKLLLKIGLEALAKSRPQLFGKLDLQAAKDYLTGKSNIDWPFITCKTELDIDVFKPIAKGSDLSRLIKGNMRLKYAESGDECLVQFWYGGIPMIINLTHRDLGWITEYKEVDSNTSVYPEHIELKVNGILSGEG